MEVSRSFTPVANKDARILILGSMPGVASLEATQYYAFPRNAFWKIMGELFNAGPDLEYEKRLGRLTCHHVALWDVIASCQRPGSLDSAISKEGLATNDFYGFLNQHSNISHIYFNGQKAANLFKKLVKPGLRKQFEYQTLPSTSPAYAAKSYAEKLQAWSVIKT